MPPGARVAQPAWKGRLINLASSRTSGDLKSSVWNPKYKPGLARAAERRGEDVGALESLGRATDETLAVSGSDDLAKEFVQAGNTDFQKR